MEVYLPPLVRIGEPISWFCSSTTTEIPRRAATSAALNPAGPPPAIIMSVFKSMPNVIVNGRRSFGKPSPLAFSRKSLRFPNSSGIL